jgi:hypothetical protein
MNARPRAWAAAAALCAAATAVTPLRTAHAQAASADSSIAATSLGATESAPQPQHAAAVGPTVASASVAVRAMDVEQQQSSRLATAPTNALPAARHSQGQPKALMIVGGAAFLAGAIIGDTPGTLIMIGGAGVGLYGLYLYLQ